MKATQQLREEHEGIKIMLIVLEKMAQQHDTAATIKGEHLEGLLEFLKVFVDKCHHGKEEDLLFPALVDAGVPESGPIAVMLSEHEMGRGYVRAMNADYAAYVGGDESRAKDIVRNGRAYISLLRDHITKENDVLFVMADDLLSERRQDELFEGFEKIEEERIGRGKHEEFHHLLEELSEFYIN